MNKLSILVVVISFTACHSTNFYQVYKTKVEGNTLAKDKIIFEDKNCIVSYNLWKEYGNVGFEIYNKTENDLILEMNKTFFVLNGTAYEYYQNRTFSKSSSFGNPITSYSNWYLNSVIVSGLNTSSYSTSYVEKSDLTIPSKTSRSISEYYVTKERYANCDLVLFPSVRNIKAVKFDKTNSPFVMSNIITYISNNDTSRIENKFFVSEITNYPEKSMFTKVYTSDCGNKLDVPYEIFKNNSPDSFYIKYIKK